MIHAFSFLAAAAVSWLLVSASYGDTFVFSVDLAATDKPQAWTHRVAEAGDYQIGMAWAEVLSAGELEVKIMADGREVRTFPARRGLAPCRLDTRVEKLKEGDEITVTATPKNAIQCLRKNSFFCIFAGLAFLLGFLKSGFFVLGAFLSDTSGYMPAPMVPDRGILC